MSTRRILAALFLLLATPTGSTAIEATDRELASVEEAFSHIKESALFVSDWPATERTLLSEMARIIQEMSPALGNRAGRCHSGIEACLEILARARLPAETKFPLVGGILRMFVESIDDPYAYTDIPARQVRAPYRSNTEALTEPSRTELPPSFIRDSGIIPPTICFVFARTFRKDFSPTLINEDGSFRGCKKGYRGIILDLRGNPGGLVENARQTNALFLDYGIEYIEVSREGYWNLVTVEQNNRAVAREPVVILTNRLTASAAELVTAALKENHRAIVIGQERTFGKGVIQTEYRLSNDRVFAVSTQYFLTPTGQPIHERGIRSDVVLPDDATDTLYLKTAVRELQRMGVEP